MIPGEPVEAVEAGDQECVLEVGGERQCEDRSLEVSEGGRCLGVQTHLQECGEGRGRYAFWV